MTRPVHLLAALLLLGLVAQPAAAFQDSPPSGGSPADKPKAATEPKGGSEGQGLSLRTPELSIGKGTGTEVRIPGIGTVGVLPKLDFGLELLYGATEQRGLPEDKAEPSDVQVRGTIKHRF